MKRHFLPLLTFTFALHLSILASPFAPDPSVELVVYSKRSSEPLNVETFSTNILAPRIRWTFPASYTGHRAVCRLAGATTNDVFAAWIGGDAYAPGDPFGVSTGRDYPVLSLSTTSPIVNRINPWNGLGDRPTTPKPIKHYWIDTLSTGDSTRLRVVRYSLSEYLCNNYAVSNRVVADVVLDKDRRPFICEHDIFTNQFFDIDEYLVEDISHIHIEDNVLTNLTYLVVVGNGPVSIPFVQPDQEISVTNVAALPILIERRYEPLRVKPTPLGSRTTSSGTEFSFRIVGEDPWASEFGTTYTACRVRVMNGSSTVYDSGPMILPIKDPLGVYTLRTSQTFSAQGLTWKVCLHNNKFNWAGAFSDPIPLNN